MTKKMNPLLVAMALTVLATVCVWAEDLGPVFGGFLTTSAYRKLDRHTRIFYSVGVVDGFIGSVPLGAKESQIKQINECVSGMDGEQIEAIVWKWLEKNPEHWQDPLPVNIYMTFEEACHIKFITPQDKRERKK